MTSDSVKAIVWDLDGTLIHFKIDWLKARREAIKILVQNSVPRHFLTVKSSILENVKIAREYFEKLEMVREKIDSIIKKVDQFVTAIEYEAAMEAAAVDGIHSVLDWLSRRNLKQAIYTYNTTENANISLENAGLIQYFDVIVGRDQVKNTKPHPEHLKLICDKLNINPSKIIVIGDSHRDIEGAINVNAKSIAIKVNLSKLTNFDLLKKADKVIEQYEISTKLIPTIEGLL